MTDAVLRSAARVLLIAGDRVLLINEVLDGPPYWLTPGGGIEPGESPQQAAARELYEETGLAVTIPAEASAVHVQRRTWSHAGTTYDQHDEFYVVRVAAEFDIAPAALTDAEQAALLGSRWWTSPELRTSREWFFPPEIADLLDRESTRVAVYPHLEA